jgi:hypothetical protein
MSITTEEAERLARFHDISKELYSDNPEDSGICAVHHTSAVALRSLAAERDALQAKVERPESGVSYEAFVSAMQIVTTERDALQAENARLREAFQKYFGQSEATNIRALLGETQ